MVSRAVLGPVTYHGKSLRMWDLPQAKVEIQPHSGDGIEIMVEGPEKVVSSVQVTEKDDRVMVMGLSVDANEDVIISNRITNISMNGNLIAGYNVVVGSTAYYNGNTFLKGNSFNFPNKYVEKKPDFVITVKVPLQTGIYLLGSFSQINIGDTLGPIYINNNGVCPIVVGKVGDTTLEISKAGVVTVREVTGSLKVLMPNFGDVTVESGQVTHIKAVVGGAAIARLQVLAQTAELTTSGLGDILVRSVLQMPICVKNGLGILKVENW